jgi:hypothetical protein
LSASAAAAAPAPPRGRVFSSAGVGAGDAPQSGRLAQSRLAGLLRAAERARKAAERAAAAAAAAAAAPRPKAKAAAAAESSRAALASAAAAAARELDEAHYGAISAHLASLAPVSVDLELRSLSLGTRDDADGARMLAALLRFFAHELRGGPRGACRRFELVQAQLGVALAVHGARLAAEPRLRALCADVRAAQRGDAVRLKDMLDKGLCLLSNAFGH